MTAGALVAELRELTAADRRKAEQARVWGSGDWHPRPDLITLGRRRA